MLITIPFKTLRFPDDQKQQWGVMLGRFIQRNNEFSIWPYITRRKLPPSVAQFGTMDGLEDISPGRNLHSFLMGSSPVHATSTSLGVPPSIITEPAYRGGVDGKVVIKDALTLDVTLNPISARWNRTNRR